LAFPKKRPANAISGFISFSSSHAVTGVSDIQRDRRTPNKFAPDAGKRPWPWLCPPAILTKPVKIKGPEVNASLPLAHQSKK
jgi:hypothetical protein